MDPALLSKLNDLRKLRKVAVLVTPLPDGEADLVGVEHIGDHPLSAAIHERLKSGKSGTVIADDGREHFIEVHVPAPRLIIIGAAHISQALYPMAQACGYDVTIIDPRTAFATEERFRGVTLHADWPEDLLHEMALDPFTALAAVTHDPKIDDLPLMRALEADCFYVGALGSRKTHGKRLTRLQEQGADPQLFDRIHAPIGMDIGAASPAEIAVAIMAEITRTLRMPETSK